MACAKSRQNPRSEIDEKKKRSRTGQKANFTKKGERRPQPDQKNAMFKKWVPDSLDIKGRSPTNLLDVKNTSVEKKSKWSETVNGQET